MINIFMFLLVLGPSLYHICEGCGRVPSTPSPTSPPTPTEPTINGSVVNLACTEEEVTKRGCLNNGTCFVIVLQEERVAACHCTARYRGRRCSYLNYESLFPATESNIATAGIAASLAVLVVIVIVFTGVAIVYYKRRREEKKRQKESNKPNGLLPENHTPARNLSFNNQLRQNGNGLCHEDLIDEKKHMLDYKEYKTTSV